jgi:glycosyltransferase 2 family protein
MTWSIRTQQPLHLERRLRQVALVAALAVVAYLGVAVLSDASAIRDGLQRLGPAQWLVLLGLSLFNYALRFLRWHAYLRALGARIGLGHDLLIYVAGFAFTVTPGKAGEAVRSVYLKTAGVPWSPGLAALAVERVLDLTAMVMLAALALRIFADQMLPALLLVIGVVGILLLVTRPGMAHWLLAWLPKRGRWVNLKEGALAMLEQARLLLAPKRLLGGLGLGLLAWAAEAWGFYLLLGWLGVDAQLFAAMGIYALGMLAGALSFLPGGLGGAEAAMVALLVAGGAMFGTAVLATVICRAATLWFAVVLGVGAVLLLGRGRVQVP